MPIVGIATVALMLVGMVAPDGATRIVAALALTVLVLDRFAAMRPR